MDTAPFDRRSEADASPNGERLDSWKEIAAYLRRSVRTLHRWEKDEGLPIHRHLHKELGSVFAYRSELDAWSRARSARLELREENDGRASAPRSFLITALALTSAVFVIAAIYFLAAGRSDSGESQREPPVARLELASTLAGSQRWPTLSPDGRLVAFVREAVGTPQVWVGSVGGGNPIQITFGDQPALRPRWSAQGDRIIYSIRGAGIWSVAPLGGEPQRIVENGWNAELSPDNACSNGPGRS